MLENLVKEQISIHYLGLLAAKAGVFLNRPLRDSGVDLVAERIERSELGDISIRYMNAAETVSIQLKCTTQKRVIRGESLKFDLNGKNYNDLVLRRNKRRLPMILVLCILPDNPSEWLVPVEPFGVQVNIEAFWYFPEKGLETIDKKSKKRISIPIQNKADLPFFENIFNLFENIEP